MNFNKRKEIQFSRIFIVEKANGIRLILKTCQVVKCRIIQRIGSTYTCILYV